MAEDLELRGFKCAALDQRGHGLSERPENGFDYERITTDLDEFLEMLSIVDTGWQKPILVGQSWGCSVVEAFAQRYPEKVSGLVLIDGGFSVMKRAFPTWELCTASLTPPRPSGASLAQVESFLRSAHSDWPEQGIQATMCNMESDSNGHARARLAFDSHMTILHELWNFDTAAVTAELTTPTVFIAAMNESMGGPESKRREVAEIQHALRGLSSSYFLEGDHDLHAQFPEKLVEILLHEITKGVLK
jgi:pimeloyl-ACP methyl ester carboxylesterase